MKNEVPYNKASKDEWKYILKQTSYLDKLEVDTVGYFVHSNDVETKTVLSKHLLPDCTEKDPKQRMQVEIILSDE